ncbi:MAG: ORF6N domain-containing protein [Gallionellaceae bacterium]|nr:ORF6N domain-containing protein [Gallionellaceae bacterium]
MSDMVKIENLKNMIIEIRGQDVLLDSDVAHIYGVETRDINKAVANNPDKFPSGYIVELSKPEKTELVENFHRFERLKHSTVNPKAFTEQGLYMLATILKSPVATQATISIIETFTKIRELSRSVKELSTIQDKAHQKALMQRSGELIAEILDEDLQTRDAETSIELNFAVLKFKHTVKKSRKK